MTRYISISLAFVALASLLFAQSQASLPWYPFWDGKAYRFATGAGLRKQLGVLDGAPGPQGPAGPQGPQGPQGPAGLGFSTVPCTSAAPKMMFRLPGGQCVEGEVIVVGAAPDIAADAIERTPLAQLPEPCRDGQIRYVPDASTGSGMWPLYLCGGEPNSHWRQLGIAADGTGYLVVHSDEPGFSLVGPNTAIVKF